MKKEEFLNLGLDDEIAEKCAKASEKELKGYVSKTEFEEVDRTKKQLETDIKDRDTQLDNLKNSTDNPETLKRTIEDLQEDNRKKDKEHAAEIKQLKIDAAVTAALTDAKAKNSKAVRALLEIDTEKINVKEDGTLEGLTLDDQIKKLTEAEDSKFLFDTETKDIKMKGVVPGESGREEPDSKVDVSKMSYEELAAYMDANPNAQI